MAYYLFNFVNESAPHGPALRDEAVALARTGLWGVDAGERHRDALAQGDAALIYVGAPVLEFVGRAEIASPVHDWTPAEAQAYQGDCAGGVSLADVEEWDPPVPMTSVLARIASETAKAEFDAGVVQIAAGEYEAALAVAAAEPRRNLRN